MAIVDSWIADLPQQFQGKQYIEALILAFSKQIEELNRIFKQLDTETDLESAVGMNLDMVGDIVTLTRKEAGILAGIDVEEPVISDERYRQFLRYKNLVNTSECTYCDIINGLHFLWGDIPIYYSERQSRPAMIFISLSPMSVDDKDPGLLKGLKIKPAGVGLIYVLQYNACIFEHLGHIKIVNIRFVMPISFWATQIYRGMRRYNGSMRYNARRNYDLRVKLKTMLELYTEQAIRYGVVFSGNVRNPTDIDLSILASYWVQLREALDVAARMHTVVQSPSGIAGGMTVETRRNVVRYNGMRRHNGTMKHNALYRKETIE